MGERAQSGARSICGIYTLGMRDPYAHQYEEVHRLPDAPFITASIGEDFADCRWPLAVKAAKSVTQEQLSWYLNKLYQAVDEGFYMDPAIGPAIYWRWSGAPIPGMSPDDNDDSDDGLDDISEPLDDEIPLELDGEPSELLGGGPSDSGDDEPGEPLDDPDEDGEEGEDELLSGQQT